MSPGAPSTSMGARLRLFPGVAAGLARLSGLLRPTLEILWVEDVARLNRGLLGEDRVDLAGHLVGQERVALGSVRTAFFDQFGAQCFYCGSGLRADSPVDHVLPWSRVGLDGLANLVTACSRCNSAKSGALPDLQHVFRAVSRSADLLTSIGHDISWPVQLQRTAAAARGLYLAAPEGTPLWRGRGEISLLDTGSPQLRAMRLDLAEWATTP